MRNAMVDPFVFHLNPPLKAQDGPLSDLRLAVKDIFDLQGHPTLCGFKTWPDQIKKLKTASLVQALIDHGIQIVGKTITEQIAYSTLGINPDYGTPTNGLDPARIPGGSSSGSASAVSLGLADVGLGSDTGGSIRIPAAYQGLWGLRPSHGALPVDGAMPLAQRFDVPGFMTRDLQTLARIHGVLSTATGANLELMVPTSVWRSVNQEPPLDARQIDLPWDQASADRLSYAFRLAQARQVSSNHRPLLDKGDLNFNAGILGRLQWATTVTAEQEVTAFEAIQKDLDALRRALQPGQALVWPTIPGPPPKIEDAFNLSEAFRAQQFGLTAPAGLMGLPQLHCPIGQLGFSIMGMPGTDLDLLETARALP